MIGRTLRNRYHTIKLLGSGGFGDTYLAKNLDLPGYLHFMKVQLDECDRPSLSSPVI